MQSPEPRKRAPRGGACYEQRPMADPERDERKPEKPRAPDAPSKGDYFALGIGCLVVIIFFAAIVVVGIMRE